MKRYLQLIAVSAVAASAQSLSHKIDLPADSPVALLSADFSNSKANVRGGVYIVDVYASLSLRNTTTQRRIRGITLAVYAQDVAPGRGSDRAHGRSGRLSDRGLQPCAGRPRNHASS